MSTIHEAKTDLDAIMQAIIDNRPVDPEVVKRVRARSAELQRKFNRRFDSEVSVELVRSIREE